ncbi:uncharacterized protein LOC110439519 [Tachysurus ichikawai]
MKKFNLENFELQVLSTSNVEDGIEDVCGEAHEQFSSGEEDKRSGGVEAKVGLPPFDPFTPSSVGSLEGARLKVCMARLHYEAQERAQTRQAELNLKLEIRKLEIEAEKQLELEALKKCHWLNCTAGHRSSPFFFTAQWFVARPF